MRVAQLAAVVILVYSVHLGNSEDEVSMLMLGGRFNYPDRPEEARMAITNLGHDRPKSGGTLRYQCSVNQRYWWIYWVKADGTRLNTPFLFIRYLNSSHSGRYTCYAWRSDARDRLRKSFDIRIRDQKPRINIRVFEWDSLTFRGAIRRQCEVDRPGWDLYWTLPDRRRIESSYLVIYNLQPANNGRYVCHVRHRSSGPAYTSEFTVNVVAPKPNIRIRVSEGDELTYGGRIRRQCISDNPGSIVYWILPDKTRVNSSYISISDLRPSNNGLYQCKVKYAEGVEPVVTQFLVNIPQKIAVRSDIKLVSLSGESLTFGGNVKRQCKVTTPGWTFYWVTPIGRRINSDFLEINGLNPSDSGRYTCHASHAQTGDRLSAWFEFSVVSGK